MPLSDAWNERRRQMFGDWDCGIRQSPAQDPARPPVEMKYFEKTYLSKSLIQTLDEPVDLDPELIIAAVRRMTDDQLRRINRLLGEGRRASDYLYLPTPNGGYSRPIHGSDFRRLYGSDFLTSIW